MSRQAVKRVQADPSGEASYPIVLARSSDGERPMWRAAVEELPGCEASGPTPQSAAAAAHDAVAQWLATARAEGREVPPPGAASTHSGRLLVRMPRSLHAELVRASEREGISLNGYIVAALSASVAWRRPAEPTEQDLAAGRPVQSRGLSTALLVNVVVLLIAAAVAIALLISAWLG